MSTRWSHLAGDTAAFAVSLSFAQDPELQSDSRREDWYSWGELRIWVGGQDICAHYEEGQLVEGVRWYLLPLLEWFVQSWDPLFHEERLPLRNQGDTAWASLNRTRRPSPHLSDDAFHDELDAWQAWWARHSMASARTGGILPQVVFRRWQHLVEVSWGETQYPGLPSHYRFLHPTGFARFEPNAVALPIFEVISAAVDYLCKQDSASTRVHELAKRLPSLESGDVDTRLGWMTGLDALSSPKAWKKLRVDLSREKPGIPGETVSQALGDVEDSKLVLSGSCHAALMFGSVAPTIRKPDVLTLGRLLLARFRAEGWTGRVNGFVDDVPLGSLGERPWEEGYLLAERAIQNLDLHERGRQIDVEGVLRSLDVDTLELELSDADVRAVAVSGPRHAPAIALNLAHPATGFSTSRRFTLAHELCHLLHDRSRGRTLAIASGPWAPRELEARANAFAAMLLMPRELVQDFVAQLPSPLASVESVATVARKLGTSFSACLEHLTNLDFLSDEDKDAIRTESDRVLLASSDDDPG